MVAGGSTISQQLAKNLFLSPKRSAVRKLEEALITLIIETVMSKERIFEIYLNIIEWGNGVFGCEAAAKLLLQDQRRAAGRLGSRQARRHGAQPALLRPQPQHGLPQSQDQPDPRADAFGGGALRIVVTA